MKTHRQKKNALKLPGMLQPEVSACIRVYICKSATNLQFIHVQATQMMSLTRLSQTKT